MAKNGWIGKSAIVVGGIIVPLLGGVYQFLDLKDQMAAAPSIDTRAIETTRRELKDAITRNTSELVRAIDKVEATFGKLDDRLREVERAQTKTATQVQNLVSQPRR